MSLEKAEKFWLGRKNDCTMQGKRKKNLNSWEKKIMIEKKSILWKPDQIKKELPSPYTPTTTT